MGASVDSRIDAFLADVQAIVHRHAGDEAATTAAVAERLDALLADGVELDPALTAPDAEQYAMHPLHVARDESFSAAVAVWGVGQATPIHDHGTWGVVGIVRGSEIETHYRVAAGAAPTATERRTLLPGDVEVCCTTDDNVHAVACGSDVPCVAIHVYGANIGALPRRAFDPRTGEARTFVSAWATRAPAREA